MAESKKSWVLSFAAIFIFLMVLMGLVISLKNRADISQPVQDKFVKLLYKDRLVQRFIAKHDFVNIIIFTFKNPGLINRGQFRLTLYSSDGKMLAEQIISGFNVGDPGTVRFQFAPIFPSKNKEFEIQIESLTDNMVGEMGIGAKRSNDSTLDDLKINGVSTGEALAFLVYYRTVNKVVVFQDFLFETFEKMMKDRVFIVFWFVSIIILLILGLKMILRSS